MDSRDITLERIEKLISSTYWTDCNLFGKLWRLRTGDGVQVEACAIPDLGRPSFEEAVAMEFKETSVGSSYGPSWATVWFRVTVAPPAPGEPVWLIWDAGCESMVYAEDGTAMQGLTGGSGADQRHEVLLADRMTEPKAVYVEMACNGMFGVGDGGMIQPPDPGRTFTLSTAEVGVRDELATELFHDLDTLRNIAMVLPRDSPEGALALRTAYDVLDALAVGDRGTWEGAHALAAAYFARGPPSAHTVHAVGHCHIDTAWLWPYAETRRKVARSWATQLTLIESHPRFTFTASQAQQYAWLEEDNPALFARVQQAARGGRWHPAGGTWVEMDCNLPSGESLARQFVLGQAYFQRAFGAARREFWLPDTFGYAPQLPQLMRLAGIDVFVTQKLSWSLVNKPQVSTFHWEGLDGSTVFAHFPPADNYNCSSSAEEVARTATQNRNKAQVPASLMLYGHGDGGGGPAKEMLARIDRFASAPGMPAVRYSSPQQFADTLRRLAHGTRLPRWRGELYLELHQGTFTSQAFVKWCNRRLEEMLRQVETVAALACVSAHGPGQDAYPAAALDAVWKDVLLCQFHDVIPGSSIAEVYTDTRRIYDKAFAALEPLRREWVGALAAALGSASSAPSPSAEDRALPALQVANALPRAREEVLVLGRACVGEATAAALDAAVESGSLPVQRAAALLPPDDAVEEGLHAPQGDEARLAFVRGSGHCAQAQEGWVLPLRLPALTAAAVPLPSVLRAWDGLGATAQPTEGGGAVLDNGILRVQVGPCGAVTSLVYLAARPPREVVAPGCALNEWRLHEDMPFFWDAWDVMPYHRDTYTVVTGPRRGRRVRESDTGDELPAVGRGGTGEEESAPAPRVSVSVVESGPVRASVRVHVPRLGPNGSAAVFAYSLGAAEGRLRVQCRVAWREDHHVLKAAFPTSVRARGAAATFETQCGSVQRPIHTNTSREWAMWEVCGHRWADVSEARFGLALANDGKYGHSARCGPRHTTLALSLLRAPRAPDRHCDRGVHEFSYALVPHGGDAFAAGVHAMAAELNDAVWLGDAGDGDGVGAGLESALQLSHVGEGPCPVEMMACKLAEDGSGDLIIRLCEVSGGHATALLQWPALGRRFQAQEVGLTERPVADLGTVAEEERAAVSVLEEAEVASVAAGGAGPAVAPSGGVAVAATLRPHQIATLRLTPRRE